MAEGVLTRKKEEEEDADRIGTEIATEDVDSSRIAGRDISSKTVYHGVDPKEHAELLSKLAMLEGRLRETEDSVEDETDEEQVIHHGVNPEDHAELISRIARLEDRLRATEYPKENMTRGGKTGVPPLRRHGSTAKPLVGLSRQHASQGWRFSSVLSCSSTQWKGHFRLLRIAISKIVRQA